MPLRASGAGFISVLHSAVLFKAMCSQMRIDNVDYCPPGQLHSASVPFVDFVRLSICLYHLRLVGFLCFFTVLNGQKQYS